MKAGVGTAALVDCESCLLAPPGARLGGSVEKLLDQVGLQTMPTSATYLSQTTLHRHQCTGDLNGARTNTFSGRCVCVCACAVGRVASGWIFLTSAENGTP